MAGEREWEDDLSEFVGSSEERAQVAFGRLMARSEPIMDRYLRPIVTREEDRHDVIQEVRLRVWGYRSRFQNRGIASWLNFLKTTTERCGIDLGRGNPLSLQLDDRRFGDIPESEMPVVTTFFELTRDRERLYQLADGLWLGEPGPDFDRRLLAGKLFYLDGKPWDLLVARLKIDRKTLDTWLRDPVVLAHVTFAGLYRGNARLTCHILGLPPSEDLNALLMKARDGSDDAPPPGWTWPETYAVLWRFRFGKLTEQIAAMPECTLDREELRALFDRCHQIFPFENLIRMLIARFDLAPKGVSTLSGSPLWRRLVFQYAAADELPHRDILLRTERSAELAGYSMTLGMLNVWLSNGRLAKALKDHYDRLNGVSEQP